MRIRLGGSGRQRRRRRPSEEAREAAEAGGMVRTAARGARPAFPDHAPSMPGALEGKGFGDVAPFEPAGINDRRGITENRNQEAVVLDVHELQADCRKETACSNCRREVAVGRVVSAWGIHTLSTSRDHEEQE